jgi:hypothetical protein
MKRLYLNRKRNFVAAMALVWVSFGGFFGYCIGSGPGPWAEPMFFTLPLGVLVGGLIGYGHGLVMYYICRTFRSEDWYE